jgi:hypothetical protein
MNDRDLNAFLHVAREEAAPLAASFQREVWQKIALAKEQRPRSWVWLQAFMAWIARPLPAAAAWSLALLCGMLIGILRTDTPSSADRTAAYVQSINPLAKMHAP